MKAHDGTEITTRPMGNDEFDVSVWRDGSAIASLRMTGAELRALTATSAR